jgi:hypothetical protein
MLVWKNVQFSQTDFEGAVQFRWPGAVAIPEHPELVAAQPDHLGAEGVGG